MTSTEIASYESQGYLQLDRPVVGADDVTEVRSRLDRLFHNTGAIPAGDVRDLGEGSDGKPSVPEIVWTTHLDAGLVATAAYRRAERVATELLQVRRVRLHFDHAIFKPARTGGRTAWHQDVYFDPNHDVPVATVWLALVDTDEQNGCMSFVPGSHQGPIWPHELYGRNGRQAHGFDDAHIQFCPLPAGGMTVHMQRTLHGTNGNTTNSVRAAWILKFIPDHRNRLHRIIAAVRSRTAT